MHLIIGVLIFCLANVCEGSKAWDYSDTSKWKNDYPKCGGSKQSPINIVNPKCDKSLNNSITFTKYESAGSSKFKLTNNGHSLQLSTSSTGASIKLGSLGTFKLEQVHFHWGNSKSQGSEHELKGKTFPAEMHMVHYDSKYASLAIAAPKFDGLAVLGVFIAVGNNNPTFDKFLNFATNVTQNGSSVDIAPFKMEDLLPENKNSLYRYRGSLTTPPCYESIAWTVFDQKIQISEAQLAKFRTLKDSHGKTLQNNFRPPQALNGRKITYWNNTKCSVDDSGVAALGGSVFTALVSLLLFAVL
ncbi:carbonic anhydrase-like [Dendronephthya gigantea]|uniref:carbonic anhydrase-like n=1 Tax=Dendronephthya gigantea TaxID=151771 RepID=UPI00106CF21D|nr:carbonic anhydrase-like [Dendronephthya gigantea]XP_028400605.1 carbonic anhydrase-like [Dendronephthya gigantea]